MVSSAATGESRPRSAFISHAHADNTLCTPYSEALTRRGLDVWYDLNDNPEGRMLAATLQKELQARGALLVFVTPAALDSFWVNLEIDAYLGLMAQDRARMLLPVRLRPCQMPPFMDAVTWIDAVGTPPDETAERIIHALSQRDGHPRAIPTPQPPSVSPQNAELFQRLSAEAHSELLASRWNDAIARASFALRMPGIAPIADLYGDLALALANVGRWRESYDAARDGRTVDFARADIWQTEARALSELARLARDTGKADDARKHDEDALTAFASARALIVADDLPGRLALLAELRAAHIGAGRWAEALATVNDELALAPGAPTRLTAKLELLRRLKRDAEALPIARTLAARPEASAADWLALAQLAHVAGADAEAAQALANADRLAPDAASASESASLRATLLAAFAAQREREQSASRWAEALRTLDQEALLAPADPPRQRTRALLLHRLGRDAEAAALLSALLEHPSGVWSAADGLATAQLCVELGLANAGWVALTRAGLLDTQGAGAASSEALTVATQLALLPGAPFQARLDVAKRLIAANRQRDAMSILNMPANTPGEQAQIEQLRAVLFPLPEIPARLASLGYRGVNRAGTPAILPPLVSVAAGSFLMGSDKTRDKEAYDNETPQHRVELAAYQIGTYPVTVAEYALAVGAGAVREPPASGGVTWQSQLQHADHPVVCVSWQDAQAYLTWLRAATGQPDWRLPSEAQWEKAARWDAARGVSRIYPWGDSFDKNRCNTNASGIKTTTPVGSYPASDPQRSGASPCGAEDMAGNVWEWTDNVYKPYPYILSDGSEDTNYTENRTLRGGSWGNNARLARAACCGADPLDYIDSNVGFRLAVVAPGSFH